jgi:hypothetical protein
LSGDTLRLLEDAWCEYARRYLLHVAAVVRLLRVAAETARAAQAARNVGASVLDDDRDGASASDRSTTSFVASNNGGSGSTADSFCEL